MAHHTAIYPGSFDPFTLGHLDVVERACQIFDCVIISVAKDTQKDPLFDVATRLRLIEASVKGLPNVQVDAFDGLTVNFAKQKNAKTIVRGLRAISDFEYEFQMSQMNKTLYPEIETVYVMASLDYTFLSSSMVKEVIRLGGNVDNLVPACVQEALAAVTAH
ncbi:MAG: pantetheine-phosphate adenylyltransferase [Cyanobacteria bacterium HKST-UBA06]|nr:pantetheine-phosphate adenylyltransferase [Cyanobacteria bacterium HKST-UBA05]MCA9798232.1 pantetheine-phosphate adenylyltransferase [Cyanobacteria bacterium HKST-UBA04]MCA9806738.1 pantetheine-phosphate adenylyltransferase [Cyanobacteria bacterium HKST-UBA06]MCA9841205.1 pantetheine-phosphate adenylyltransferase [Cyanobacteria bacterium HKST-UBA03]